MEITEKVNFDGIVEEGSKSAFDGSAKTARTLRNIKHCLQKEFKETYGIDDEEKVNSILKIHGLNDSQFDFVANVENALNNDILNDISVDPNANKGEKTIEALMVEAENPGKKAIGYDMLYRQMKKDYGKDEAKRLSGEMYSYALALADSTKILSCYCYALDASILVKKGRDFGQLHSAPCKRLCSYISALCETIHQMSNHLAGAIAVGTFFMDVGHILMYKEGYTLDQITNDKTIRKMIENEYQQFVHSVNHLSRNAAESPFTNLSVFDKPKLKTLIEGMDHYFDDTTTDMQQSVMEHMDYIVTYIMELQKIFIDFFDKGDKLSAGMPFRFPIVTNNISKSEYGDVLDPDFLEYIVNKDIYRYNIFASSGTKVASCCFRGDQRLFANGEMITFGKLYENEDKNVVVLNKNKVESKAKVIQIPYTDKWIKLTIDTSRYVHYPDHEEKLIELIVTKDHLFPVPNNRNDEDIKAVDIQVGDFVSHYAFNGEYLYCKVVGVEEIENTEGLAYCVEMDNKDDPYFLVGDERIITHNCRLINNIDLMREYGSQSNSFGGVGISLGSHRVITINFNRIALEAEDYGIDYFKILDKRIEDCAKVLASHKRLLELLTKKGYQLFIQNGWVRMDRLFSTFGILGLVEARETLKVRNLVDVDKVDIIQDSLEYLEKKVFEMSEKYGIMGNIEQIPAESMAIRLAKTDRILFGEHKVPYKLYANQFVPLWKDASIWEKLSADGKYNKLITGGGIVHAQIGEKVTPNQAKKIIKYAIQCGCEHFALNAVYTKCNNNHFTFGNKSVCPVCGSQYLEHFTRVVGFFTKVENWAPERKQWEFPNRTFVKLPEDDGSEDIETIVDTPKKAKPSKKKKEEENEYKCINCTITVKRPVEDESKINKKENDTSNLIRNFEDIYGELTGRNDSGTLKSLTDDQRPKVLFFYRDNCEHCHEVYDKWIRGKPNEKWIGFIRCNDDDIANNNGDVNYWINRYKLSETPTVILVDKDYNMNVIATYDSADNYLTMEDIIRIGLKEKL